MAIDNKIEYYPQNTQSLSCIVQGVSDVSGYIPYLTVKKKTTDEDTILTKTGVVSDASGTLLFSLTASDTSIAAGYYVYDITIEKDSDKYTVVKDKFIIIDGVRYS